VVAEGLGQDYFCYIVPIDRRPAQVVAQDGKPINAKQVCWQAGEALAFSSDVSEQYEIGVFHTSDGRLTWLTQAGQGDQGEPDFSPDGRWMACVLSDGPETWLTLRDLESATVQRYEIEPGIHAGPAFTPDGRSLVLLFDNPRHPPDLWRFDLAAGAFYPLTTSLPASLTPDDFVMPQHVQYDSPDGRCVPALLFLPDDFRRALAGGPAAPPPAVVIIHGGPSWLFQYLWYPVMAHCASRGWTVLAPNYRGSTGYGRAWQYANRFEMGNLDTLDVAAGVDYLVSHGLADPQRVGVTGRSHGGFLTMSCLTRYPEIFAVGSAIVPFLNWFTSHAGSRDDLKHWDLENMGSPLENADLWRERSPYFFLDRIRVPVQMVCGANDPRCPASESIAARDRLLELRKEVELLLYEDEGHAFLKVENVVDHELKRISFLARVLDQDR
jgi:dipeptidyl aminopeptidase/acylaminoacyl peptidase